MIFLILSKIAYTKFSVGPFLRMDFGEVKDKPFLTTKEAAAFTGIGEHTLRRLAKDVGYEICFYVGDKLMFKRNSLIAYLENCEEL